jgi:4-amino-4-deoxy-L-arabinose transferase-like glycosyltransferase
MTKADRSNPPAAPTTPTRASTTPILAWRIVRSLGVVVFLTTQLILAELSLGRENPTVDEVAHLPAGVTYWEKGTFRLYPHNPPLVKLLAAAPVVWSKPNTDQLYQQKSWSSASPSHPTFSQSFARLNIDRYFELFHSARMLMPAFLVVGGLVVYLWASRLHGPWGGFLSLALWTFCPNLLAHGRLITTDAGSAALGVAATYVFWRYMQQANWKWAVTAGIALGLAQITKFSMLVLLVIWPFLWLVRLTLVSPRTDWLGKVVRTIPHAFLILVFTILVIDVGYRFEGVGQRLGDFEFASGFLTRRVAEGTPRPKSENDLLNIAWHFRVNRFRGTFLERLPVPLPRYYIQGFDEQKLETEGIPTSFFRAMRGDPAAPGDADSNEVAGYDVYLNGVMRSSGWWYYYLATLLYKLPEGTCLLLALSILPLVLIKRSSTAWADEIAVATIPLVIFVTMSFLTDINLGLRYVLGMLPFLYIGAGRIAPWIEQLARPTREIASAVVLALLASTIAATASIHPHYLAYFNWTSGGPDRVPARLIDSNLDWGQDLIGLKNWCRRNIPGQPIGLAYFGQINPTIFTKRDEPFPWYLPPIPDGAADLMYRETERSKLDGFAPTLTPGYYAISATLLYGLHWRLYDPALRAWDPAWNVHKITYDLQVTPWDDEKLIPNSGRNLVVLGVDSGGLLHIRIFDSTGTRITDTIESKQPDNAAAIARLKSRLTSLESSRILTNSEKEAIIREAASIVGQPNLTDAFGYFRAFSPIARIGHSIYVFRLSQDDIDRLAPDWLKRRVRSAPTALAPDADHG